MALAAS